MYFTNLVFFVFAVVGMTNIIVESSVMMPFRQWVKKKGESKWLFKKIDEMINCYQCCGTWVGFFVGFCLLSYNPIYIFLSGCAGSFVATLAARYFLYLDAKSIVDTGSPPTPPPNHLLMAFDMIAKNILTNNGAKPIDIPKPKSMPQPVQQPIPTGDPNASQGL